MKASKHDEVYILEQKGQIDKMWKGHATAW